MGLRTGPKKAKEIKIDRLLLTVQNHNAASIKVAMVNGGIVEKIEGGYHFI